MTWTRGEHANTPKIYGQKFFAFTKHKEHRAADIVKKLFPLNEIYILHFAALFAKLSTDSNGKLFHEMEMGTFHQGLKYKNKLTIHIHFFTNFLARVFHSAK